MGETVNTVKHVITRYFCDKCGAELIQEYHREDTYKVEFKGTTSYPGDDIRENKMSAYFCESCAGVVRKLLEENGVVFISTEDFY